jgi:hypothetical protein
VTGDDVALFRGKLADGTGHLFAPLDTEVRASDDVRGRGPPPLALI